MARILIADDEDLERTALRYIISSSGLAPEFIIDEARNGHEALDFGKARPYDAIFLDIKMPGLDGLRAAEELRKSGILAPIVIISAFDTFEYAQKAIRLGVYEYLLKPAGADEVVSALQRSLSWSQDSDVLFRKKEESISAISEATKKIKASLEAQMEKGFLDGYTVREFENLSSMSAVSRSALAFRIGAGTGDGAATLQKALLNAAFTCAEKAVSGKCRKMIKAESGGIGCLLLYGFGKEASEGNFSPQISESGGQVIQGGFLKSLKGDLLCIIAEAMRQKIRESASSTLLCGIAGPSNENTEIVFARALEGAKLASAECPVVRLASLASEGKSDLLSFGPADASPKSLGMKALDYIKSAYSRNLTLVSAAEAIGVNSFHLSHAISRELGIGFSELLNRVRINRAKELMMGGGSIKEASYLVGFSDQAYFTRVFKKLEGMNPGHYIDRTAKKYKR